MTLKASDALRQLHCMVGLIVNARQKNVLETHPPSGSGHISATVLQQVLQRVSLGSGNQVLPQRLVWSMEAHRQGELTAPQHLMGLLHKGVDVVGNTHGADGDAPLANAQVTAETLNAAQHRGKIEQGFSHAHKHHMGGLTSHGLPHAEHLVNDLVAGQGALQSSLACGTKATGHGTPHLAGHTDR